MDLAIIDIIWATVKMMMMMMMMTPRPTQPTPLAEKEITVDREVT